MNLLGLVFSLLLILSYGFFACWEKQISSTRLRGTYLGHQKANRKILNSYESELYETLRHKKKESEPKTTASEKEKPPKEKKPPIPLNGECAKLNLYPLIQKGKEENQFLYETAAKLLRFFYQPLYGSKPRFEYKFLDAILSSAQTALQNEPLFALEKLSFSDEHFQLLYYKMLKGTKECDLSAHVGYPSLLDYIKIEPVEEKICLFHAHPDLLSVFFGAKAAPKLFEEIHKEKAPPLTFEAATQICCESHLIALDPDLNQLLLFGQSQHRQNLKKTLAEQDSETQVSLRKNVFLKESI